ncbi:MAG: TRAP transporter substrate-binding protein DctP, partial [Polyangiales bacterium]
MRRALLTSSILLLTMLVNGDPFHGEARAETAPAPSAEPSPKASAEAPAAPQHQLRIATLAPRQSDLGRAFQQLRKELKEVTNGQVNLKMYDGGVAGDEMTVVRKMRVG